MFDMSLLFWLFCSICVPIRSRLGASLLGSKVSSVDVIVSPFVFRMTLGDAGEHPFTDSARSCFDRGGLLGAVDPGEELSLLAKLGEN